MLTPGWAVHRSTGPAGVFHGRTVPSPLEPTVWIHDVTGPALVLGSAQPDDVVDRARAEADGMEVVRRRSGGGLVVLVPGNDCWIDVLLPRSSDLWHPDVGLAFAWLGQVWASVVAATVTPPPTSPALPLTVEVHRGAMTGRVAGRVLCFAGTGPGEVSISGRKVVGLSLRRSRDGARFQCAMTWRWQPDLVARYLRPDLIAEVEAATGGPLSALPVGLADPASGPTRESVIEAFLAALPRP